VIAGPVSFATLAVPLSSGLLGVPASAQARREAAVQPVSDVRRGDLLLGVGVGHGWDADFPLGALSGDLLSLGRVTLAYGLGDAALIEIQGDAWRILSIERRSEPAIELDPGVADGTTADAGDFEITVSFAPIGRRRGLSGGGLVRVRLPNSDERKGIGTNTTDVTLGALASWGASRWRVSGVLGVGILEAPLEGFEQNDVLEYAMDAELTVGSDVRVAAGVDGRANTRDLVPLGTENLARVRLGAEWRPHAWGWDLGVARGITGSVADWSLGAGVSWTPPHR